MDREIERDTEMNYTKETLIKNSQRLMGDNPNHTFYAVTIRPEWSFIKSFPSHAHSRFQRTVITPE